jgi:hypothetical protein
MVLILALVVACGDDNDADATAGSGESGSTATIAESSSATTPADTTPAADDTEEPSETPPGATATEAMESTPTTVDEPTETTAPDDEPTPTAEAAESPTAADSTPTNEVEATPSEESDPLGELDEASVVLENFTLSSTTSFESEDGVNSSIYEIMVEQSAPDEQHIVIHIDDAVTDSVTDIEYWWLGDQAWMSSDGSEPLEMPADGGSMFESSLFLIVPDMEGVEDVEDLGGETIDGRETTHYRIDASQIPNLSDEMAEDGTGFNDPEGTVDIWVDDEENFIVQMTYDIEWTDDAGVRWHAVVERYVITQIGTTPDVQPPV